MLSLDKKSMDQHSIATDLELRAKNRTIAKLKRQADQYKTFNREIHYLMEPQVHKDQIVGELRQKAANSKKPVSAEVAKKAIDLVDPETASKIEIINRGFMFQKTQTEISKGTYFKKKYDLDFQIEQHSKKGEGAEPTSGGKPERKRDNKANAKQQSKLLFKFF